MEDRRSVYINGTVTDKAEKRPLPYAEVTIGDQTVITDVIGRFALEVRAGHRHSLHVTHERALKELNKTMTVLDKNLRIAISLEVEPKPPAPVRERGPSLVNFGEGEAPVTEVFEYEKPDEAKLAAEAAAAGQEFISTWTTMEEEALNMQAAEEDDSAEMDLESVLLNLQASITGELQSPGGIQEAIIDGRNCIATLRSEGRYEESETVHRMLYEIESARGVQDSCFDSETLEVNQALEEISDRLEGAILGQLSVEEGDEAKQDALNLLEKLRNSHHEEEADLLQRMLDAMEREMGQSPVQESGAAVSEPSQQQPLRTPLPPPELAPAPPALAPEPATTPEPAPAPAPESPPAVSPPKPERIAKPRGVRFSTGDSPPATQLSPPLTVAPPTTETVSRAEVLEMMSMMEQRQHAAALELERQIYNAMNQRVSRISDQMVTMSKRMDKVEEAFGGLIEDLPDRVADLEKAVGTVETQNPVQLDGVTERIKASEQFAQRNDSRLTQLEQKLPMYSDLTLRVNKVEQALQAQASAPAPAPSPVPKSPTADPPRPSSPPALNVPQSSVKNPDDSLEQRVEKQLGQWEQSIEQRLGRLGVHREVISPRVPRVTHKYVAPTESNPSSAYRTLAFSRTAEPSLLTRSSAENDATKSRVQSSPRVAGWCGEISAAIEQHCNELARRVDDAINELQGADNKYKPGAGSQSPASPLTVNDLSLHPNPSYTGAYTSGYTSPVKSSRLYANGRNQELSPFSARVRSILQQ